MNRLPRLNYRKLVVFLKEQGCEFRRDADGSHEIWWHPAKRLLPCGVVFCVKNIPSWPMATFPVNANHGKGVADTLISPGHSAILAMDVDPMAKDEVWWGRCRENGWVLVTRDKGFGLLARQAADHPGVRGPAILDFSKKSISDRMKRQGR